MTTQSELAALDAAAITVLEGMAEKRRDWIEGCDKTIELLAPEWERFEQRTGHNTYVARLYADHVSERRKHLKEIEALEQVVNLYRAGKLVLMPSLESVAAHVSSLYTHPPRNDAVVEALRDVADERKRQVDAEGWSPDHDDSHAEGQLAGAAACYALTGVYHWAAGPAIQQFWPWDQAGWKPADRRRNLVKAAALLLAEIERLDRASLKQGDA